MIRYNIYCSEEQTKRAFELGVPIEYHCPTDRERIYHNPTAEQMIGWLEEQGVIDFYADRDLDEELDYCETYGYMVSFSDKDRFWKTGINSRKEATLEAIDVALDYLEKKTR